MNNFVHLSFERLSHIGPMLKDMLCRHFRLVYLKVTFLGGINLIKKRGVKVDWTYFYRIVAIRIRANVERLWALKNKKCDICYL